MAAAAIICSAGLWLGCGGTNTAPGLDAGDAQSVDSGPQGDSAQVRTCVLGDGGVAPQGKQLVSSPTAYALGVTSDGYAIYEDRQFSNIYAVPLSGGTPDQIGPSWNFATSTYLTILGPVVYYWTGETEPSKSPTVGELIVWTAAGRARPLAGASFTNVLAVSASGKYVAYSDNAMANIAPDAGTGVGTTDLFVSGPDGSNKTLIASNVPWDRYCVPTMAFVGDALVTATCASAGLAQPAATLRAYRGPAWTPGTTLNYSPAYAWSLGHDAGKISYLTSGYTLTIQNVAQNLPPVAIFGNVYTSLLTNDGTSVIFMTYSGLIFRSSVTGSFPSLVSTSPFINVSALSPDDQWLIVNKKFDANLGLYDTYLLSTGPNSTPTALVPTTTGAFLNDWFTADNSRVIFGANNQRAPVGYFGDFATVPLSAPSTPAFTVTTTAWSAYATKGSKTVYNDGYEIVFPELPTADIQVVDLASPGARTKLVSHADANFYVNIDRAKAVYSWTYCADDRAGLYVVDLP